MRISDWSSDVCSSDLRAGAQALQEGPRLLVLQAHVSEEVRLALMRRQRLLQPLDRAEHRVAAQRRVGIELGQRAKSEEHTSELQSLMRISYAVFCLKKKKK